METIRIGIVDDNRQNVNSLVDRIGYDGSIVVEMRASNGDEFLSMLKHAVSLPSVVLMDIEMPVMDGIEAVRYASVIYPNIKFLMLTIFDDDEKIFEAIKAGAIGYLLKDEKVNVIVDAIHQIVHYGAAPMSPRIARKTLQMLSKADFPGSASGENVSIPSSKLSDREIEILKLLVTGIDYREIAKTLFLSPHTVRNHIASIYSKLHVSNKAQAILLVKRHGW